MARESNNRHSQHDVGARQCNTPEDILLENAELKLRLESANRYIRAKVNQLLTVMGTSPLRPEELDDQTLIELDPIGIISDSFKEVLRHLHKTNERLKIANEEIQAIFDSAGMGILVVDRQMNVLAYNEKMKYLFSMDETEILGRPCSTVVCRSSIPVGCCPFAQTFVTGSSFQQTDWVLCSRHYDVVATPVKDGNGDISRMVLVYMDITERIQANEALRKSEEKYRDLFENANDLIQIIGPDGSLRYVNRSWRELLGYTESEINGLSVFDVIHPDCVDQCDSEFRSVVFGERAGRIETMFISKTGVKLLVEGNVSIISRDGKFGGTRGIFRDISSRKEAEASLASEKERLAVTLRSIGDGVITTDTKGRVVLMNEVAEELTGWSQDEAAGHSIREIFHIADERTRSESENPVDKVLKQGQVIGLTNHSVLTARDGTERLIADSGAPIRDRESVIIGVVLVFRDVTEQRRLVDKLVKAEKIESLGVLAGGIAHDFNNLLNAIMGNIDLAAMAMQPGHESLKSLERAEKAVMRARDLTSQLLTFSKGGAPIKKAASVVEVIRDSADFALRGTNVLCEFSLPGDLWRVEIDEGQISQVISNLVINAVQSMPKGGKIRISAEKALPGNAGTPLRKEDRHVRIVIRDEGMGIPQEDLPRIFEPYFTTKHAGTGLGLATTYSIIRAHGGTVDVESEVGRGTTFYLSLPAVADDAASERVSEEGKLCPQGAAGHVLVMDDDDLIRTTAGDMLSRLGYEVELAADGLAAIELYSKAEQLKRRFDLVILDLTVPGGLGGQETMKRLLEIDPDVKGIVSSGYSSDSVMANYREYGFSGVLAKPYRKGDLSAVIQSVMSRASE